MLGLKLREEFKGRRLKGTAIELSNQNKTGAIQVPAKQFLEITYPSGDVLNAIEAVGPGSGRPVVLIGDRGQGKSHIMGVLYHAFQAAGDTLAWLKEWAGRLANPMAAELKLRDGMFVITESLHRQNFKFLWDLVFTHHPEGKWATGKWEGAGDKKTDVPSHKLMLELFEKQPTALVLDEFQTWYDGLTNTKQHPWRIWAFNFIQILSEIAKEHPELLVLVVSVRNGNSDAFQQIQRVNPVLVNFKGPNAKRDRQRLLLHRLFTNRLNVPASDIEGTTTAACAEFCRLMAVPPAEADRTRAAFSEAWPYAPHLMRLLEDQVLVATHAQETRDLIRILADLFKRNGDKAVITAADFRLDDEKSGIAALLDSVANQHHANLLEKAQRNLEAVHDAVADVDTMVPHLRELIAALWLRSLREGNIQGASAAELQVDITRDTAVDDNLFAVELATIAENSFNIHEDSNRYVFKAEENPQAKLIASARNDKLFQEGQDTDQLAREVRYVIGGGEDVAGTFRVVALRGKWLSDPWSEVEPGDVPDQWDDRIPVLVLPECPDKLEARLGEWLRDHLQKRRNAVRFLFAEQGSQPVFADRDLIVLARAVHLAEQWKAQGSEYRRLQDKYERELRGILKKRYDRFAILASWDFQNPTNCRFHVEKHQSQGAKIPEAIDEAVRSNLFIPEDFSALVLEAAKGSESVGKLMKELQEPRPNGEDCIPWLGETLMKERLLRICSRGDIAINLRSMEYLQVKAGEDESTAWLRMKSKLGFSGKHLDETYIVLPQNVPAAGGTSGEEGGGLFGGDTGGTGGEAGGTETGQEGTGGQGGTGGHGSSGIFDPSTGGLKAFQTETPTSALNLAGRLESWGVNPGTQVHDAEVSVSKMTGAQLAKLIKNLPDGLTYSLSIKRENSE
jgi:hypothetical protein